MPSNKLRVGVVGGLGLMSSPMARHWKNVDAIEVCRVHDRGNAGERRDQCRQAWRENGAILVNSLESLVGQGDLDGVFVCCGKNGDDLPLITVLTENLARVAPGSFICHLSTVSTGFVSAAHTFCAGRNVRYVNYPLTGGQLGAENASLLILASGDKALYEQLSPALSLLGTPRHFSAAITAAAEVKFMGHLMGFNGLVGICSAAAIHTESLNAGQLGGEIQADFFDFLNAGAGGTRQWEVILSSGIRKNIWHAPFLIKYGVVDAIYAAQMCIDRRISRLAIEPIINLALAFSYVIKKVDPDLATQAIVKEIIATQANSLDQFLIKHSGPGDDSQAALENCVRSLPENVRRTVALNIRAADFEEAVKSAAATSA